jgi:hypothetical protein
LHGITQTLNILTFKIVAKINYIYGDALDSDWTYKICEICSKNSHEKIEMKKERIFSTDANNEYFEEMWICPTCGSTKKL